MSWYRGWNSISAAERSRRRERELARLRRSGREVSPVRIEGRAIARSFWGMAWCDNLATYSDYANRLPRGRTYVRNGSVLDLQIAPVAIEARVSGTRLYQVSLAISPLPEERWSRVRQCCAGQIDSVLELLEGKLSRGVMDVVTHPDDGLFPTFAEIELSCSCPDWARMCKHVAAVLYGIGARLDEEPELLFTLRDVDPTELVEGAFDAETIASAPPRGHVLAEEDLSSLFGVDIDLGEPDEVPPPERHPGSDDPDDRSVDDPDPIELLADALAAHDGQTVKALVATTGFSTGIVRRRLAEMEAYGLVVKTRGERNAWCWWLA